METFLSTNPKNSGPEKKQMLATLPAECSARVRLEFRQPWFHSHKWDEATPHPTPVYQILAPRPGETHPAKETEVWALQSREETYLSITSSSTEGNVVHISSKPWNNVMLNKPSHNSKKMKLLPPNPRFTNLKFIYWKKKIASLFHDGRWQAPSFAYHARHLNGKDN